MPDETYSQFIERRRGGQSQSSETPEERWQRMLRNAASDSSQAGETFGEYAQRRRAALMAEAAASASRAEGSIGGSFVHGLSLDYGGSEPQTLPQWLAYGAGSIAPFAILEAVTSGTATPLLGARAAAALARFSKAHKLLAPALRQAGVFGAYGALRNPKPGDSRLGNAALDAALGGFYPPAAEAAKIGWRAISPKIMPALYTAETQVPEAARAPLQAVIKRLIGGEQRQSFLTEQHFSQLGRTLEGLTKEQRQRVLDFLEGKTLAEARAELPPELFPTWGKLRGQMNLGWAQQQMAERQRVIEEMLGKGATQAEAEAAARTQIPSLKPPIEGYWPHGASANYFVLRKQPSGNFALTPGSRDVARTYAEAQDIAQRHLEAGVPESDISILPRKDVFAGRGTGATRLPRPAFWGLVSKLAKREGVSPSELLEDFGSELPVAIKKPPYAGGKFAGFRQKREDILGAPEHTLEDLKSYLAQSSRFSAMNAPLASVGREREGIVKLLGGEGSSWQKWLDKYLDRVAGKPSDFENRVNELMMSAAEKGNSLAAHFAGDPYALRRLAGSVRMLTGLNKLGFSPSSAIWNLAQTSNTFAIHGSRVTARAIWEVLQHGPKWEPIFKELHIAPGAGGKAGVEQLEEMAGTTLSKLYGGGLWLFGKAEGFNRRVAATAGYLAAKEAGATHEAALKSAADTILRTQFHYGAANVPEIMAGPLGKIIFQFRPFIVNQLAFMLGLSKREAARFFPAIAALAGTGAIPLREEADALFNLTKDQQPIAEFELKHPRASSGILGALGISTQEPLSVTQGLIPQGTRDLLGPTVGDVTRIIRAWREGNPVGRAALQANVLGKRIGQVQDLLETGGIRAPATGELIYEVPGQPKKFVPARDLTTAQRMNVERLLRLRRSVPLVERQRWYQRYQRAKAEQGEAPGQLLTAILLAAGLTPTALRAHTLAGNLTAADIQKFRRLRRTGMLPGEIAEDERPLE